MGVMSNVQEGDVQMVDLKGRCKGSYVGGGGGWEMSIGGEVPEMFITSRQICINFFHNQSLTSNHAAS